jgi:hypothetical protein
MLPQLKPVQSRLETEPNVARAAKRSYQAAASRGTNVKKLACLLAFVSLACGHLAFADEFQKVRCDADIPKALIGQHTSNERVAVLEKRYHALGLKDLGAEEISDRLSSVDWQICGAEFILLIDRRDMVRDVLPFPAHSKRSPAFTGICQAEGRDLSGVIVAILDGAVAAEYLPVQLAWKIDQQHAKFVKASVEGLVCPRSGIYSVDGGP